MGGFSSLFDFLHQIFSSTIVSVNTNEKTKPTDKTKSSSYLSDNEMIVQNNHDQTVRMQVIQQPSENYFSNLNNNIISRKVVFGTDATTNCVEDSIDDSSLLFYDAIEFHVEQTQGSNCDVFPSTIRSTIQSKEMEANFASKRTVTEDTYTNYVGKSSNQKLFKLTSNEKPVSFNRSTTEVITTNESSHQTPTINQFDSSSLSLTSSSCINDYDNETNNSRIVKISIMKDRLIASEMECQGEHFQSWKEQSHFRQDCNRNMYFVPSDFDVEQTIQCTKQNSKYCVRCYCYVCKVPVSECNNWPHNHCNRQLHTLPLTPEQMCDSEDNFNVIDYKLDNSNNKKTNNDWSNISSDKKRKRNIENDDSYSVNAIVHNSFEKEDLSKKKYYERDIVSSYLHQNKKRGLPYDKEEKNHVNGYCVTDRTKNEVIPHNTINDKKSDYFNHSQRYNDGSTNNSMNRSIRTDTIPISSSIRLGSNTKNPLHSSLQKQRHTSSSFIFGGAQNETNNQCGGTKTNASILLNPTKSSSSHWPRLQKQRHQQEQQQQEEEQSPQNQRQEQKQQQQQITKHSSVKRTLCCVDKAMITRHPNTALPLVLENTEVENNEVDDEENFIDNDLKEFPCNIPTPAITSGCHYRFNCSVYTFYSIPTGTNSPLNNLHCKRCYCYVCNTPVHKCYAWEISHAQASNRAPHASTWEKRLILHHREEIQKQQKKQRSLQRKEM